MKNYWFLLLLVAGLFAACNDDDEHMHDDEMHEGVYDAAIQINSPAEGAMVTVAETAHIHVDFTRPDNKIIHNVKVEVLNGNDEVVKVLIEDHAHEEGTYSYHSDDFTPDAHGAYKLRATTTNDAGEEPVVSETSFTAMHGGGGAEYKVDIEIVSPADAAVAAINQAMEVEVTYTHQTHGEIIHNIMIDVIDADNNVVGVILETHAHSDMPYSYKEAEAWTPTKAGDYTLRAMTTDMDQAHMNMVTRAFKVQ